MSRRFAAIAGILGVAVGAIAGSSYLGNVGSCSDAGASQIQCAMNTGLGPFISAIAIGFVVAIGLGHALWTLVSRLAGPAPRDRPGTTAAVDVGDPVLQIAAWGRPPGGNQRVFDVVGSPEWEAKPHPAAEPAPTPARTSATVHLLPAAARRGAHGELGSRGKSVPTPREPG